MTEDPRAHARELCAKHGAAGDPLGWFEALYREARDEGVRVPWADNVPNPHLVRWHERTRHDFKSRRCLVVGCGLGDDAEYLMQAGGEVVAFDIAPSAVASCRERFSTSRVEYVTADLLAPPPAWTSRFDFVFEAYTLPVLPASLKQAALQQLSRFLAPAGTLLVVCRGREASDPPGEMPWPLTRAEVQSASEHDVDLESFEDFFEMKDVPVRRFRAVFRRRV